MTIQGTSILSQPEILAVDDSVEYLHLLTTLLTEYGYHVRAASDGELALRSVAAKVPDLILLDVRMPGMDGYEVCRRLKDDERSREVPVIFISAVSEIAEKVEGFRAGGIDFIAKPFDAEEVQARVNTHLELRRLQLRQEHAYAEVEDRVRQRTAELAEANRVIKKSEERLSLALQVSNEGVWDWDLQAEVAEFNPRYYTMLGYEPGGFANTFTAFIELVHPDDRERVTTKAREMIAYGGRFEIEFRMLAKDGSIVHILSRGQVVEHEDGSPTRMVGTHMAVTARKIAETALKEALVEAEEARDKISAILKSVADGLLVTDLNCRVVLMNKAAERLAGTTQDEAFNRPIEALFAEESLQDQFHSVMSGDKNTMPVEWEHRDKGSQETRSIQARTAAIRSRGRLTSGMITILRDVTRERELDRAKNEFISTAAHELRTPLTSVMCIGEMLLNREKYGVSEL